MVASGMGSAMSFDVIGIVLFIIKENQMTRVYNQYSTEFKQTVCEYYSNHTWRVTAVHFGMPETYRTAQLCTSWYKALGFLPKSAGRNPSMARVKSSVYKGRGRGRAGVIIKSGGYIFDNKFYGKSEFLELKGVLNSDDTFYTVVKGRAGDVISDVAKPNVLTKLFRKFM
jgi:hypothetical protein